MRTTKCSGTPSLRRSSIMEFIPKSLLVRTPSERLNHLHLAMLIKRGKIIAMATNREGSRSSGCGYSEFSLHAERAVIKEVDLAELKDCILVVVRIHRPRCNNDIHLANSKPCRDCETILNKFIRSHGLRAVYYS